MTKKIDELHQTPWDGEHTQLQSEITNKQIDLHDIMTLVEKLEPSGKTIFFHNLSEQKNLSENVFALLLNQCDSQVVFNLCKQEDISWKVLDMLVQKLIGICEGKEEVPVFKHNDEEDFDFDEENENEQENEEEKCVILTSEYMNSFLPLIMENSNLTSQHIENMIKSYSGPMWYHCMENICLHSKTPSWILKKMYEINPQCMRNIVFSHPNISDEQRNEMMPSIAEIKIDIAETILAKHTELDKYEVLKYYENKNDQEIAKILAEYLYNDNLWSDFYGNKWQHEDLKWKLQLAQKYNLWEEYILRILYDMIGDNIADIWKLEIYERYDEKRIYLTIPEAEAKYWVTIGQEKIKDICCKVLEQMPRWFEPEINIVNNVYQVAKSLEIEITEDIQKIYIHTLTDAIKNNSSKNSNAKMDHFASWQYFYTSLQLILEYKHLFTETELEQYISVIDDSLWFPLDTIDDTLDYIKAKYGYTTNLWEKAKEDWYKEVKSLQWMDIFDLMKKIWVSDIFTHKIVIEKIKKCLHYNHADGKELIQRFNISQEELIDLIVHGTKTSYLTWYDTGEIIRCFSTEWTYSLEECLEKYDIPSEKIIPSLMWEIKKQLVSCIKDKNYTSASIIIKKYNLADHPELAECIDTVKVLTQE